MLLNFERLLKPVTYKINTKKVLYDINPDFCIPTDNSPCIQYKHGMYNVRASKGEMRHMFSS